MDDQVKFTAVMNMCFGLWLSLSPFILGYSGLSGYNAVATIEAVVIGVIVLVLAPMRFARPAGHTWPTWVNLELGAWMIVSPYLLGTQQISSVLPNDLVVGIGIVVCSLWNMMAASSGAAS